MVSISVSEDDFGEFVASYFLILYELATPTICACLLGNYWYCRFGSFQHNIYIERERSYMHSPSVPFCTVCKAGMDENPYFFSVQYRSVFQHTHDALFRKKNGQKK